MSRDTLVKDDEGVVYSYNNLRFYLELPATVGGKSYQGPFIHRPGDDDSGAVTFWGKQDLRIVLRSALALLDAHYTQPVNTPASGSTAVAVPDKSSLPATEATEIEAKEILYGEGRTLWNYIDQVSRCLDGNKWPTMIQRAKQLLVAITNDDAETDRIAHEVSAEIKAELKAETDGEVEPDSEVETCFVDWNGEYGEETLEAVRKSDYDTLSEKHRLFRLDSNRLNASLIDQRDPLRTENEQLLARCEAAESLTARWKTAIEGLTPQGSEYVNDPDACAAAIRQRCQYPKMIIELKRQVAELSAEVARVWGQAIDIAYNLAIENNELARIEIVVALQTARDAAQKADQGKDAQDS